MNCRWAIVAAALLTGSVSAHAAVITSLPGGTALPIPAGSGTHTSATETIAPGVTADPLTNFTFGYSGGYGFSSNGSWSGTPMIGLDTNAGSYDINFASPISAFLGELNWTTGASALNATLEIFGVSGLLESLTLENAGGNAVAPGFYGFSRSTAEITKVRFSNEYIGVRNISISSASSAVPEPGTWAMMLVGFGAVGFAMRRKQRQSVRLNFA